MEKEKISIGFDGDVPFVDDGKGEKVYEIPVQWLVSDIVKIRANSLEEAIQLFMDNEPSIPCGLAPEYVADSYQLTCDAKDVESIVKEFEEDYGESMVSNYDSDYEEEMDER